MELINSLPFDSVGPVVAILILLFVIILFLCAIFISFYIYFLPSIISRKKSNFVLILLLNIFLAWTFIGWIILLILALATGKNESSNNKTIIVEQSQLSSNIDVSKEEVEKTAQQIQKNIEDKKQGIPTWLIVLLIVFGVIIILTIFIFVSSMRGIYSAFEVAL